MEAGRRPLLLQVGYFGDFRVVFDYFFPGEAVGLFVIYGLGYFAVELVFVCLYRHAFAKRAELQLSPVEEYDTRSSIGHHSLHAAVAILSCLIAAAPALPPSAAGFSHFSLGPLIAWHATHRNRARRRLIAQAA